MGSPHHRRAGETALTGEGTFLLIIASTIVILCGWLAEGKFRVPVVYDSYGPVWINIQVSQIGNGWQIDHVGWNYKPLSLDASH